MIEPKPSKSELKRQDEALKALGQELIGLGTEQLDQLPLDDRLRAAVDEARAIRSRSALRRQRQYVAKLLRQAGADEIQRELAALRSDSISAKRRFRLAEEWRDRLLDERFDALSACANATGASEDELRDLLKTLARAKTAKADKTAKREIFRAIHSALDD